MPRFSCLTHSKLTRLAMSESPKELLNKILLKNTVIRLLNLNTMILSLNILSFNIKIMRIQCSKHLDSVFNITELHKVKITTLIQLTTLKEHMSSSLKDTSVSNSLITRSTWKTQPHLTMDRSSDKWNLSLMVRKYSTTLIQWRRWSKLENHHISKTSLNSKLSSTVFQCWETSREKILPWTGSSLILMPK